MPRREGSVPVASDSQEVSHNANGSFVQAVGPVDPAVPPCSRWQQALEVALLVGLFFAYAGDPAPMVNEAHYLVKAKNFWDPEWCNQDLFVASGKVHTTFYTLFGWPTQFVSLATTAWVGRLLGWALLAFGLQRLTWALLGRRFLSLAVAVIWIAGIEYGNLAGEWVLGGIEAKVPAYGLMLWGLAQLVQRRWNWVWILFGTSAAFHVLTGGWAVVAAMGCWFATERNRDDGVRLMTPALFIGGAISLFGLIPALAMSLGSPPEQAALAARIYSYYRIKHHLLPADFHFSWYARFGLLIALMVSGARLYVPREDRFRRLNGFVVTTLGIAALGLVFGLLPSLAPDLGARVLRYYWFRLADAMVPLMVAVLAVRMLIDQQRARCLAGMSLLLLAVMLSGYSAYRRCRLGVPPSVSNDLLGRDVGASPAVQQQVYRDWRAVCDWARHSSDPREVFLTPRHQQTFKWFAHRAEVVNWKDVPQDPSTLLEWYRRFEEIYPEWIGNRRTGNDRVSISYANLREFRQKYGTRYMIVDRRVTGDNLPLVRLYPTEPEVNATYAVYELPFDSAQR